MLGAIIGDMAGSIYEFANTKRTDFPFFSERSIRIRWAATEEEPIWTVNWYKELIPDVPLIQEQYDLFTEGYYPDWECAQCQVKYRDESLW